MVVQWEESELVDALESVYLSNDARPGDTELLDRERFSRNETTSSTERITFAIENEARIVSALGYDDTNNNESDQDDIPNEQNPIITHECGETESMKLSDEGESTSTQESTESGCTEASDDPKERSPTQTAFSGSQNFLSGDVNENANTKNDEEINTMNAESSSSHSTDDNTANDPNSVVSSTIPSYEQDSIQNSLTQRRVRLVYMTPEEVLSHRDRIVKVQTRQGPFLFLPLNRNTPYTPRPSSVDPAMEGLVRMRNQLRQDNSNLQHILSLFQQSQRIRRSNIKRV